MYKKVATAFLTLFFVFALLIDNPQALTSARTYFLQVASNYNYRFINENSADRAGYSRVFVADINNNDQNDIVFSAPRHDSTYNDVSKTDNGSVYLVYDSLLSGKSGDVSLGDTNNFSVRFDGAAAGDTIGLAGVLAADLLGNDGKKDLVIISYLTDLNGVDSGTAYVIDNSIFAGFTTSGNILDLSDESNYTYRINGHAAGARLADSLRSIIVEDFDYDGKLDLVLGSYRADYDFTNSGSLYIISNTILNSYPTSDLNLDDEDTFFIRIDGGSSEEFGINIETGNFDGNNLADLLVTARGYSSRKGAVYIIKDDILSSYSSISPTGNIISLQEGQGGFNIRFSGPLDTVDLGYGDIAVGDIDNNGIDDLLLSADGLDYGGTDRGSAYLVLDNIFSGVSGVEQNLPFTSDVNYTIRVDGAADSDQLNWGSSEIVEYKNDGNNYKDLLLYAQTDFNSLNNSGSVYVIFGNNLFSHINAGTKNISISDTNNYDIRYDGTVASGVLGYFGTWTYDLNQDAKNDLILVEPISAVGGVYIILNYPHSISTSSAENYAFKSVPIVRGTVNASTSVTTVSGVEWSTTSSATGNWTSCTADDGLFDEKTEDYSCNISGQSPGNITVYIRSFDSNESYTHPANYPSVGMKLLDLTPAGPETEISPCSQNALFAPTISSLNRNTLGSSVSLSFSNPGNVDYYEISYGFSNLFQWSTTVPGNRTTATVSSLVPSFTYQFRIRGVTTCNVFGPWSATKSTAQKTVSTSFDQITTNPFLTQKEQEYKDIAEIEEISESEFIPGVGGYIVKVIVRDTKKSTVSGANVELHSTQSGVTDSNGEITFKNVEAGDYTVYFESGSYKGKESLSVAGDNRNIELNVVVNPKDNQALKILLAILFSVIILLLLIRRLRK